MQLSTNWLTEHMVDAEYKKYQLLAYLQDIKAEFSRKTLFPSYKDLLGHFYQLRDLRKAIANIRSQGKTLQGIDWQQQQLIYTQGEEEDPAELKEIQTIIAFAYPLLDEEVQAAQALVRAIQQAFRLSAVGLVPLRQEEGYLLLHAASERQLAVFRYWSSPVKDAGNRPSVHTHPYGEYTLSPFRSYEHIKYELIRENKELPNPAVYSIVSEVPLPLHPTFLPIASQYFAGKVLR